MQALGEGFSLRSVERMLESGKIRSGRRSVPGRRPVVVCDPEGVAKVAGERRAANFLGPLAVGRVVNGREALTSDGAVAPVAASNHKPVDLQTKIFLTLDEAVEYSGLPASCLHAKIRAGILKVEKADRWLRISRKSLESLTL